MAPLPSLTKTWHNTTYAAITPTNPTLSVTGKTIIITGGGRGIGLEMARAFAEAGAAKIVLTGRTETTLADSARSIEADFRDTKVSFYVADVADEVTMQEVAKNVGAWDVLVLNAGVLAKSQAVHESEPLAWWRTFETNVKGAMVTTHAFLPHRSKGASIVGISADMVNIPVSSSASMGTSAYVCSKIAQIKLLEFVAAENPDVFVVSVHPGVVETDMLRSLGESSKVDPAIIDNVKLPAHFLVWVVSEEAKFLKGRFVCVNWDVEELKARTKEIQQGKFLTAFVNGWPYDGSSISQAE